MRQPLGIPSRSALPLIALPLIVASTIPGLVCQEGGQEGVSRAPKDLGETVVIDLEPGRASGRGIGWSPKGATVRLTGGSDGVLSGRFRLGPDAEAPVRVELRRSASGARSFDVLAIDADRDGAFGKNEILDTTPNERRDKFWSSWSAVLDLTVEGPEGEARTLPYPINLWYVFDPREPDAEPVLRWSRRGWMEGDAKAADGDPVAVVVAEMAMDGVYDARDRWSVARTVDEARRSRAFRGVDDFNWCGEEAWRLVALHPSGLRATLKRHDPGMTRAEDEAARDRFSADRRAPRAEKPMAFGHDFEVAESRANAEGKPLFIDFETTWCGPCKQMDALVYTARDVVDAARSSGVVPVKVDGDEHPDLVERFGVKAYPTMILLSSDGEVIRRATGYRSVAQMKEFLSVE